MIANIAFVGQAGAGKTTASQLLVDRFDLGYERISFAEPLKVMLDTQTDRRRLQEFGTDIVRKYEPAAWVRLFLWQLNLKHKIRAARLPLEPASAQRPIRWVNDDCRFENELATLLDEGWWILEVQADQQTRIDRLRRNGKYVDGMFEHESENSLGELKPHGVILNNGGEDELIEKISAHIHILERRT